MNELLQRWLMLTLLWRMAWLCALSLALSMLVWLLLLRPNQQMQAAQYRQLEQMQQQQHQRQQQLAAQPTIASLQSEIAALQPPIVAADEKQTLEAIVAARGNQLEAWHPDNQPQQLQLKLEWVQFLPLFSELAHTTLAVPQRFQLQAEQGALHTQLWLEDEDEE